MKEDGDDFCDIIEAADGEDGLTQVITERPDCILLDYSLPGRNGIEVLKRIRLLDRFLPVVMMTGQGNEALAVHAIREGAQNYISKGTISGETLRRSIRLSMEHATMERRIVDQKQTLEMFTRALAHDLKEPVRTIRCFLEILQSPDLPEEKALEYRRFVYQAAQKLDSLIDSVYDLLRADAMSTQKEPASCDPAEALASAAAGLHVLIAERQATIAHDHLEPCAIPADQLARVFQNLICNAIQHSRHPITINVTSTIKSHSVVLAVSDNGPGIETENHAKLFQPFVKISLNPSNLGLGLSICKKIIESFNGMISYETAPDKGTTFYLELPKPSTETQTNKFIPCPLPLRDTETALERGRILIVDDSLADIELARYELIEDGHLQCDLITASSGQEALNILTKAKQTGDQIDLVLLDINMPCLDGFETLAEIRARDPISTVPVFMCTTSSYDGDRYKAEHMGADDYIVKPLTVASLANVLDSKYNLFLKKNGAGLALCRADGP